MQNKFSIQEQAAALLILRNRKKIQNKQDFSNWLKETSPQFEWDYPHLKLVRSHLQQIVDGKQKRIMVLMPPQHGKSLHSTIHFSAFFLETFPTKRVIIGAYNWDYASRFSLSIRRLLTQRNFKFGDVSRSDEINSSEGGFIKAFGFQSGITGISADLIIIDDPLKNFAEARSKVIRDKVWSEFEYSIESREQPSTSFIIILTRWHSDDLIGRLLKRDGAAAWDILKLPALAEENDLLGRQVGAPLCPDRKTLEKLLKEQKDNPSKFAALYQQNPRLDEGNILKEDYFTQIYSLLPRFDYIVQSLDTNSKPGVSSDFAVLVTLGVKGSEIYLLDVWRKRCDYVELKNSVLRLNVQYKPQFLLIEESANGYALIQEMRKTTSLPIKPIKPHGSKEVRLMACTPLFENKKFFIPKEASWLYDYLEELLMFPSGEHDDQVDATAQALQFIQNQSFNLYKFLCN